MKKIYTLLGISLLLIISACSQTQNTEDMTVGTGSVLLSGKISQYPFSRKMDKPANNEIKNLESMQNGFYETWTKNITKNDIDQEYWKYLKSCDTISIFNNEDLTVIKNVDWKELDQGSVAISGKYNGGGLDFTLNTKQKDFLDDHGWLVFDPGENWNVRDAENFILEQEERARYYQKIGGYDLEYKRYPYNTIFVTTDMMLHFYHKIFSNALKYYEESTARTTMQNLSIAMFDKFTQLYQNNKNSDLAPYYAYASAYWAVPYSILIPTDQIQTQVDTKMQESLDGESDLSDQDIKSISMNRFLTIKNKIAPEYQEAVQTTLQEIFEASQERAPDALLAVFGSSTSSKIDIQQDYTQFTPRSHYTNSSLLKTYFMGMKRFMREKLYLANMDQAKAALIMINNIKDDELKEFTLLYDFIQKLIGQDDDVNIQDIQSFISSKGRQLDQDIIEKINKSTQNELKSLRPQRIVSTHYQTNEILSVTEQEAKDELAGFVFFGEKFTIDSRIFDSMTAGSSEEESLYKPSLQTSLIVPDGLINTGFIDELVEIWMQEAEDKYGITKAQISGYNKAKAESQNTILSHDFNISTYHQWLNGLGRLFALVDPNRPYFMQDDLRKYKNLNTFQGNYTELKHDTLLYTKQAYAEMGMGGEGECSISIDPPALPIPKGYVEPNVDIIDSLLSLTQETQEFFAEDESFVEFSKFLSFARAIAIKETKNEIIDNNTYEQLRTYFDQLLLILYPKKVMEAGNNDFISALIADIFTSENNGPLYIANGRPALLITNIKDINGSRAVIGPVYSTFEFYGGDNAISGQKGRYTDDDWRLGLDDLPKNKFYTLPMKKIIQE